MFFGHLLGIVDDRGLGRGECLLHGSGESSRRGSTGSRTTIASEFRFHFWTQPTGVATTGTPHSQASVIASEKPSLGLAEDEYIECPQHISYVVVHRQKASAGRARQRHV